MSTKSLLSIILCTVLVVGFIRFGMTLGESNNGGVQALQGDNGVVAEISGNVQRATIQYSRSTHNYAPSIIHLKKNVPAEITVDLGSINGCLTSILIPAFGINFAATAGNNVIKFTPDRGGSFAFHCPMFMGRGTLIVE